MTCFFATDLHGSTEKYRLLFERVRLEKPDALFLGGDLLPSPLAALGAMDPAHEDFINGFLAKNLSDIRKALGDRYPDVFLILGNDDGRIEEAAVTDAASRGIWHYAHNRIIPWRSFEITGYAFIPPSPFMLKDWERYDVSRFVDPGCIPPDEGIRSFPVSEYDMKFRTIEDDLRELVDGRDPDRAIFLFHTPPYQTSLDRAALDGKTVDHAPLDVHVGSIAVKRMIETFSPLVTLHGHVHESARLTGAWMERTGRTYSFNGAHDGPELSLIRFDPRRPEAAVRELLS